MTLVRLIEMCRNETYNRVSAGTHMYDMLHIKSGMKQDVLSPLLFNFALEYDTSRVQEYQDGLKLNGTHQLPIYADYINIKWEEAYIL
jgi:hypothetical protein